MDSVILWIRGHRCEERESHVMCVTQGDQTIAQLEAQPQKRLEAQHRQLDAQPREHLEFQPRKIKDEAH
jgi:hypothetical protein